jgi:RimJ/RimL family protein N-acetyltransferase
MQESFYKRISIREYRETDLKDLISANYPIENSPELRSSYKTLKSKILDALQMSETRRLVLYHKKHKKCIGIVTLRKVNKRLWGIWDVYIVPSFRGHGLSIHLYRAAFSYLKQRGVKKAFGSVDINNIPSRKTIERIWDGYLPQKYYKFNAHIFLFIRKIPLRQITIRDANLKDKTSLFQIYSQCVSKKWRDFLEIGESNFLGFQRILPGPPFHTGILKFMSLKRVLIAENLSGQIIGYAVTKRNIAPIHPASASAGLYLFLSPDLSPKDSIAILSGLAGFLHHKGFYKFEMFTINRNEKLLNEISLSLENYGLKTSKFLVCTKNLAYEQEF